MKIPQYKVHRFVAREKATLEAFELHKILCIERGIEVNSPPERPIL